MKHLNKNKNIPNVTKITQINQVGLLIKEAGNKKKK